MAKIEVHLITQVLKLHILRLGVGSPLVKKSMSLCDLPDLNPNHISLLQTCLSLSDHLLILLSLCDTC